MTASARTYTVYARFPSGAIEETDVVAVDEVEAQLIGLQWFSEGYEPGAKIVAVEWRAPGLFHSR